MASTSLSAHIEKLRASPKQKKAVSDDAIVFWGTGFDRKYLAYLKGCVGSTTVYLNITEITTLTQVAMFCSTKKVSRVLSTSIPLLKKLLHWEKRKAPSLDSYAGSYFTIPGLKEGEPDIEIVFTKAIKQLATVPFGKFMAKRIVGKLTKPDSWYKPTPFEWYILTPEIERFAYDTFSASDCFLICIDIETLKENAQIRCLSYTGFFYDSTEPTGIRSESVVLPLDSEYALATMRKWNLLPAPKVMQGGMYDIAYLARYNAPVYNYLYDTANLFHCWYSELPKDLGFLNSFFIREAVYWKDLAETNDLHEYYRYNALDTWGTGNCFLAMLLESPEYAIQNYLIEFPLVFPCHMSEMTGIERDMPRLEEALASQQKIVDTHTASLNTILDIEPGQSFNVASPKQVKQLLHILGCKDLKDTSEKSLKKARFRHPFNARIVAMILETRKARKLISTYITPGKEFSRQDGTGNRILYTLKPYGTDTGRLASQEHHFWCGLQIQNIPRPNYDSEFKYSLPKFTLKADPGFLLAEVDLEQAESRDTGYISGDKALINNVEHSPDFHCANASAFFGIPFDELYDISTHKKLNIKIRDIAKNVNHGANYNMGAYVLIDTMGEENIVKAKHLLGLPRFWGYVQVAEYLLEAFHKTYPDIKKVFYEGVKQEIMLTHKLVSTALHYCVSEQDYLERLEAGEGTWTRHCFGDPSKNKQHLNSYIAHPPQNLNAMTLNKAYLKVFHNIAIHQDHARNIKLGAQIHDSIFFQYRIDHYYICEMVKDMMEVPVTIRAYDKKIRTFTVPAGIKSGTPASGGVAKYWSETE